MLRREAGEGAGPVGVLVKGAGPVGGAGQGGGAGGHLGSGLYFIFSFHFTVFPTSSLSCSPRATLPATLSQARRGVKVTCLCPTDPSLRL